MPGGIIGYGTKLRVGATPAATTATVDVADLVNIPPPGFTRELKDVTSQSSPGGFREYIGGLKDGVEIALTMIWVPGRPTDTLLTAMGNETDPRLIEIEFTQVTPARKYTFRGLLMSYEPDGEIDGEMRATASLKVAGAVTVS